MLPSWTAFGVTGTPVGSAWCNDAPEDVERLLSTEKMDLVVIARAHLGDPHYTYKFALELGVEKPWSTLLPPYAYWLSRYRGPGKGAAH